MITKLTLPNGQWIDVKDRQTVRDETDVHTYSNEGMSADGYRYSIVKHRAATAAVRIVNWSVKHEDTGKDIPWPSGKAFKERLDVILALYEEQGDAIHAAITEHLNALAVAKEAAKKATQDGATNSEQSSPSAS
jgi:hypothetical protein